ncbi:MAG: hypothetical protein MUP22_13270, partial [Desulfobacterales bacterium]|nr:hypothetical protein [Desulfobacterales bacterium]
AGQDFHFRKALGALLATLLNKGQAIIIATHDLAFAEQHAHHWLLMADGQIILKGTPWEVMAEEKAMKRANMFPTDTFRLHDILCKKN